MGHWIHKEAVINVLKKFKVFTFILWKRLKVQLETASCLSVSMKVFYCKSQRKIGMIVSCWPQPPTDWTWFYFSSLRKLHISSDRLKFLLRLHEHGGANGEVSISKELNIELWLYWNRLEFKDLNPWGVMNGKFVVRLKINTFSTHKIQLKNDQWIQELTWVIKNVNNFQIKLLPSTADCKHQPTAGTLVRAVILFLLVSSVKWRDRSRMNYSGAFLIPLWENRWLDGEVAQLLNPKIDGSSRNESSERLHFYRIFEVTDHRGGILEICSVSCTMNWPACLMNRGYVWYQPSSLTDNSWE